MNDFIDSYLRGHEETLQKVRRDLVAGIGDCARMLAEALRQGKKVLIMGNGGSAADAQHFAAELVGRFLRKRQALAGDRPDHRYLDPHRCRQRFRV